MKLSALIALVLTVFALGACSYNPATAQQRPAVPQAPQPAEQGDEDEDRDGVG